MTNNELLSAALSYADKGLAVFPCKARSKQPRTEHGVHDATIDTSRIKSWWSRWPDSNIGIACGRVSGGLVVIDLDIKADGTEGNETLTDWERQHGELPETVRSITGKGGYHLLYRSDRSEGNRVDLLPAVDVRGDGGYIVAPPSVHPNGHRYEWEFDPDEIEIAPVNKLVRELLDTGRKVDITKFTLPATIPEGTRNDVLFRYACSLQAQGLSDEVILDAVTKVNTERAQPPCSMAEVDQIVRHALEAYEKGCPADIAKSKAKALGLQMAADKAGKLHPRQCIDNVVRVLQDDPELAGKVRYNEFAHSIMYFGQLPWKPAGDNLGEWQDSDDAELRLYLDNNYQLTKRLHALDGFQIVVSRNRYNPLTGYLNALEWDGTSRIRTIMSDYLGVEPTEYNIEAYRVFLQGAIHRAYNPGCKFDLMLVLIGPQGAGKSTFLKYHALQDDWFNGNYNFRSTDSKAAVENMAGKWILEMAELETFKKDAISADAIKSFITTQADVYRTPFDRRPATRKRTCVFCGSSNDVNFLKDRTGNRRFLPIDVHPERATKDIFDEETARKDVQQVMAEAVAYYKQDPNRPPVLSQHIVQAAIAAQQNHLEEDAWVGLISDYLEKTPRDRVNATCIWKEGFNRDPVDLKRAEIARILTIMRHDVRGWRDAGRGRISGFGNSSICFEREPDEVDQGFTEIEPDDVIPF